MLYCVYATCAIWTDSRHPLLYDYSSLMPFPYCYPKAMSPSIAFRLCNAIIVT